MIYIGNHLSSSKGFEAMGKAALKLGANTFAFFTRNPRGGKAKEIDPADAERLRSLMEEHHFGKLVAHAPYTMNVCAAKMDIREFSWNILKDDMERMEYFPGNYYNFHPGAHVGQGAEEAIPIIADALNHAIKPDQSTVVLLETMAGKGSEVGRNFEELERVIELVDCKDKIGVCFDTCHTWDGGYDLVEDLDGVLRTFDQIIGLDRLKAVHLNDSMNVRDSHKDRHQKIGEGEIGAEALKRIVTHPLLAGRPFILETPNDDAGYAREIAMIKSWVDESMV
ncbi:deoxyribonuclease IV [Clostridium sp. OM05-9]|jgi:apurinic endonuclease (APN1)|uniref:deoxyribonuclease IV n=1 Tax=Clostridium sp. OM05-9 TaxID=2293045 RepID=UPI000E51D88A|nr:deoxyribonuclease IV [Clostridium sp. OM05-9]RHV14279.1 deoxyribonuclease IV [Clostridium sp. OM05-9]